ncbi:MAG: ATP-binding cassette domain-containing protein [Verrucomicrobia bacterium]|jgi:putative ABC transport system ATP-binding protein|nr:ATP-binding cassette domain-containing protein [Verrucomicrobiota bacterium]MBT7068393.1 ATP-binding cassette domain-containing protein [Verrucomicrobiota bacterium]MBT7698897.1 ATP-binding cassette domain-containing protein [Verrucomicrobiota bacterium]
MRECMLHISSLEVAMGGKQVLNRFSLEVAAGERLLVTAPSGAGKSTLLRCVLGFITPDRGTIRLNGHALDGASIWGLRHHMAYVAQEPVLGNGTVQELLERPFTYHANRERRENLARIPSLLEQLALSPDILGQELRSLSGGEKQRIALLAALLLDRPLLLLDEIIASLDRTSADAVFSVLAGLAGVTVLAVGHHETALPHADRIVALHAAEMEDAR